VNGTAWGYYAVSSSPQEATLADQEAWAKDVARARGWEITRSFSGTASGRLGVRTILEQLIAELTAIPKTQRPDRILLIRLDRTGRVALETIAALARIKKLGVILHTRTDGDVKLETALDTLRPIFELVSAEIENSGRSDKMRAVHARWREAGKHLGPPPYGTEKDAERRLIAKEPQASFVRRAFEMRATGAGFKRIARDVGRFAPPQGTYAGRPHASAWHPNTVDKLLSCRSYRGLVVDADLWDLVQTVHNPDFRTLRASRVYPWPLSGVLHCWCGWTMGGVASGKEGRRVRYYSCRHPRYHGDDARPSIRADRAEGWFVDGVRRLAGDPQVLRDYRASAARATMGVQRETLAAARAELADVDQKRQAAWNLQSDGRIAAAELALRLDELQRRRSELLARIVDAEREVAVAAAHDVIADDAETLFAAAADLWATSTWEEQKELSRLVALAAGGISMAPDGELRFGADDPQGLPLGETSSTRRVVYRPLVLGAGGVIESSLRP
jgi:DNA invertase Pin-like site-specific DNA recombinase